MNKPKASEKGALYVVTLRGREGEATVKVRAESGDDAALKAAKSAHIVVGVTPA